MRIWVTAIGSRPGEAYERLASLYLERIRGLLAGSGARSSAESKLFRSEAAFWETLEREHARTAPMVVLLDERGRQMDSEKFAGWLGRQREDGKQLVIFALGPADGWLGESKRRASLLLSLSSLTMPHELARVVICEQVYRALTILAGHPYHRGKQQ